MAVLVAVATAVMVAMYPVDTRLDCCAHQSSNSRPQSHEIEWGLVLGLVVVAAIGKEVVSSRSCFVVMGVIQKVFYHQKR